MKGNPADLRELGHDIQRAIEDHPNAIACNPDLHTKLKETRDTISKRVELLNDKPKETK